MAKKTGIFGIKSQYTSVVICGICYQFYFMHHCVQQRANKINAITRMTGGRVAWFGRHDLDTSERLNVVVLPKMRAFLSYTRRTLRSFVKNRREIVGLRLLSGL